MSLPGLNILAIETSSRLSQIALFEFQRQGCGANGRVNTDNSGVISRCEEGQSHSKILLELIASAIEEAQISLRELDVIAVTQGPGSFTGLRIGIAAAQAIAFAHDLPVMPVSSLQLLAYQSNPANSNVPGPDVANVAVLSTIDARMQQVYAGWYVFDRGWPVLLGNERVVSPQNIKQLSVPQLTVNGAWQLKDCELQRRPKREGQYYLACSSPVDEINLSGCWLNELVDHRFVQPLSATALAELAAIAFLRNDNCVQTMRDTGLMVNSTALTPIYIRDQVVGN